MESIPHKKSTFNQNKLLICHNIRDYKSFSNCILLRKYKIDEDEKKFLDFLDSKLEVMENMNLDDECLIEDEIETRKTDINKNVLPNSEHSKSKKSKNSAKKIKNKKKRSRKSPESKNNNRNMIVNYKGKVEKTKIENFDFIDVINLDVDKEIKKKDLRLFFSSNKDLLNSIISEMNDK